MARTDEEKRKAARERARDYANVRLPIALIERIDALRDALEVPPARERYIVALLEAEVTRREAQR
jgi:hypothetical protein